MRKEQGRRDDLWSFLYMLIEFILQGEEYLLRNCPHEFYAIFDHIRYLGYSARPNYALITRKLSEICERKRYTLDDPYDWEKGG
ncbi:hypothetical protein WUBG_11084, partial [Wuchereria bancrofti]